VHHFGTFPELEDQLCEWVPGVEKSPDRLDALVWALSKLSEKTNAGNFRLSGLVKTICRY
jgi:phage terminase large subunit-like protein